jgi:hypothetical protein
MSAIDIIVIVAGVGCLIWGICVVGLALERRMARKLAPRV